MDGFGGFSRCFQSLRPGRGAVARSERAAWMVLEAFGGVFNHCDRVAALYQGARGQLGWFWKLWEVFSIVSIRSRRCTKEREGSVDLHAVRSVGAAITERICPRRFRSLRPHPHPKIGMKSHRLPAWGVCLGVGVRGPHNHSRWEQCRGVLLRESQK